MIPAYYATNNHSNLLWDLLSKGVNKIFDAISRISASVFDALSEAWNKNFCCWSNHTVEDITLDILKDDSFEEYKNIKTVNEIVKNTNIEHLNNQPIISPTSTVTTEPKNQNNEIKPKNEIKPIDEEKVREPIDETLVYDLQRIFSGELDDLPKPWSIAAKKAAAIPHDTINRPRIPILLPKPKQQRRKEEKQKRLLEEQRKIVDLTHLGSKTGVLETDKIEKHKESESTTETPTPETIELEQPLIMEEPKGKEIEVKEEEKGEIVSEEEHVEEKPLITEEPKESEIENNEEDCTENIESAIVGENNGASMSVGTITSSSVQQPNLSFVEQQKSCLPQKETIKKVIYVSAGLITIGIVGYALYQYMQQPNPPITPGQHEQNMLSLLAEECKKAVNNYCIQRGNATTPLCVIDHLPKAANGTVLWTPKIDLELGGTDIVCDVHMMHKNCWGEIIHDALNNTVFHNINKFKYNFEWIKHNVSTPVLNAFGNFLSNHQESQGIASNQIAFKSHMYCHDANPYL